MNNFERDIETWKTASEQKNSNAFKEFSSSLKAMKHQNEKELKNVTTEINKIH